MPGLRILTDIYFHTQSTASNIWTVNHNLNTISPVVDCFIDNEKIIPSSIEVVNNNTVTIIFSVDRIGVAKIA